MTTEEFLKSFLEMSPEANCLSFLEINYPFSTKGMDISHDFSSSMLEEVRHYCKKEHNITIDKLLMLTAFYSQKNDDAARIKFSSETSLRLFNLPSGEIFGVLLLGSQIFRE